MVDVRRYLTSFFAVAAISSIALPSFALRLESKASDWRSAAVGTETANQTTGIAPSDEVGSDRELPKKWLILGMGLAATVAVAMLFILFKPDKILEKSDRDSESSET